MRILLVDDHAVVRSGLAALLSSFGNNFEVVGEAANGREALNALNTLRPDLVMMDLSMPPDLSGLEATRLMRDSHPEIPILILSMHEEKVFVEQALRAGAKGYVVKHCTSAELRLAITTVAAGGTFISPAIAQPIVNEYLHRAAGQALTIAGLTLREQEILQLMAQGHTSAQIALHLTISLTTVRTHIRNLMQKLGAHSRLEAVALAMRHGLVEAPVA